MISQLVLTLSNVVILAFVVGIPVYGTCRGLAVFDVFAAGAKKGFETSMGIMPYLVAMMVAIGMLRASGFFELLSALLSPVLEKIGMPAELLPLALIRPFSGSAATAMMAELIHEHGGNALISNMAATILGSTETTFYVIAVYFGSIGITKTRHTIAAGLLADLTGIIASVMICRYWLS